MWNEYHSLRNQKNFDNASNSYLNIWWIAFSSTKGALIALWDCKYHYIIDSSSGGHQLIAVNSLIEEYDLKDKIIVLVLDKTGSNTGTNKGVITRIEKWWGMTLKHCQIVF